MTLDSDIPSLFKWSHENVGVLFKKFLSRAKTLDVKLHLSKYEMEVFIIHWFCRDRNLRILISWWLAASQISLFSVSVHNSGKNMFITFCFHTRNETILWSKGFRRSFEIVWLCYFFSSVLILSYLWREYEDCLLTSEKCELFTLNFFETNRGAIEIEDT